MTIGSMGGGGTRGGLNTPRGKIIAALDIGTNKICCLIAEAAKSRHAAAGMMPEPEIRVIGVGYHAAMGLRGGTIVDMRAAEYAIRAAVEAAESMAGVELQEVFVNVSGGNPSSERYSAEIEIAGDAVRPCDAEQVFHLARAKAGGGQKTVIHAVPVEYHLDGQRGIGDPCDMFGASLGGTVNVVSVAPGPMRNLALCVERCHLDIAGLVISPYASGLAVLVNDEREIGVTCVDIGAGTTSVAVFSEGKLIFAEVVPVGGNHITSDIARGLSTPLAHAERMKTLFGSAIPAIADERELMSVPLVGEHGTDTINKIPKSILTGIIQPRLEEIFEIVRDRLLANGLGATVGRRIVLTGGSSQMTGARELAGALFDRQVRVGAPTGVRGLSEDLDRGAMATAVGLLKYGASPEAGAALKPGPRAVSPVDSNYLVRVGNWLRESF